MSTELIRTNYKVAEEIVNLYDDKLSNSEDEELNDFIKTEKEKILHNFKINEGYYKGRKLPRAWDYLTGYNDGKKIVIMKKFNSFFAFHYKTNKSLSPETLVYIDSKIKVVYNHARKLINKLNKRQEKLNNKQDVPDMDVGDIKKVPIGTLLYLFLVLTYQCFINL